MRRSLAWLALPAAWMGCFSSNDKGPADAGPGFDASVLDTGAPEAELDAPRESMTDVSVDVSPEAAVEAAPAVDASVDVSVDAGPAAVTVSVISGAGPEAGVPVVFADASGGALTSLSTDAAGVATYAAPSGGSVTVLLGTTDAPSLTTILAVQPGQNVVVLDWASFTAPPVKLTSLPTSPALPGSTGNTWRIGSAGPGCNSAPCTYSSPPYGLGHFGATVAAALATVVEAQDSFGVVYGFAYARDIPLSPLDDAGAVDIALGSTWSTNMTMQTLNVTLPDDGGPNLNGTYYSEVADGIVFPLISVPITTHPGLADFVQAEADFGNSNWPVIATRAAPPAASGTVDIDATAIASAPTFTGATATLSATGQPTLSWTLSQGTLAGATGLVALMSFTDEGGAPLGTWTVVAPGTAQASLTGPALPTSSALAPLAGASLKVDTLYAVTGQTAVPTYGDLVGLASRFAPLHGCVSGPFVPPLPAAGAAIVSIFANANGC